MVREAGQFMFQINPNERASKRISWSKSKSRYVRIGLRMNESSGIWEDLALANAVVEVLASLNLRRTIRDLEAFDYISAGTSDRTEQRLRAHRAGSHGGRRG